MVVLPFENASSAPGIEWISEAFPAVLEQRLASPSLYVISRQDRLYAFDRLGVPTNVRLTRATLYRIAEAMDVDFVVFGRYNFDGQTFTGSAQLLDMKKLRMTPEMQESGPLTKLIDVQTALAWDLLKILRPDLHTAREQFVANSAAIRLDAFESYVRGILAPTRQEQIRHLREAIRLNPAYTQAIFQLGKAYFAARDYETAASWFARIPGADPLAREGNFDLGLCAFYLGDFARAETAFNFLLSRLPLTEIYNNLGVVAARRGKKSEVEFFEKAVEADPNEADYHFNLGVALLRSGDNAGAIRQVREALTLRPSDTEARSLLEQTAGNASTRLAGHTAAAPKLPLERIKSNYDEASYRALALEIQNAAEVKFSTKNPAEHAAYHVERGRELLAQGFIEEAEASFREAILLDPTNADGHAGLARALENTAPANSAAEARTAIQLHPSAEAWLVLARLDMNANHLDSATENINHALVLEPSNATAQALRRTLAAKLAEKAQPLPPQ